MYTVDHIIGNTNHDDALGEAAEAHDSAGTLERVLLDASERKKSRLRVHTEAGTDLGVLVDKPELEDGDVLYHDDDRMIVVSFEEREALTIDLPTETALSTALELGHRVGNQHWDLAVEGGTAYVAVEAEHRIVEDVFSEVLPPGADLDYEFVAKGDVEAAAYDLVDSGLEGFNNRMRDNAEVDRWASKGAFVVEQHPNHPDYLICEMETSRGCAYRCSFCTEPLYGNPAFRAARSVVDEVDALSDRGVKHFRLGRQADILAFGGDGEAPNPDALRELYGGIRAVAPDLKTLHLDNMNPVTITEYPEASREAIRVIAEHNTPGDTAAFGLESADPVVQEQNNLLVTAEECLEAVRVVNEEGGWRPGDEPAGAPGGVPGPNDEYRYGPSTGPDASPRLPKLLPGINLVHGLTGERPETYEHNKRFLQSVYDEGLMLRRINIRQVMAFAGTEMAETGAEIAQEHKDQFQAYKREVRETIDNPMLDRVVPPGTVLPDVHLEYHQDGKTFGRQIGTYALLVAVPGERELGTAIDVAITDHGYRSVTGVPYPLDINAASMNELTAIPGINRSKAGDVVVGRPYDSVDDVDAGVADLSRFAVAGDTAVSIPGRDAPGAGPGPDARSPLGRGD